MSNLSTFAEVGLVDARASAGTLIIPNSCDIPGRVITFKDLYGATGNSTIALLTSTNDFFEDGTSYRTLANPYDFITLYAASTNMWSVIGGTVLNSLRANTFSNSALTTSSIVGNTVNSAFVNTSFLYPQPGLTFTTTSNLLPPVNATTSGANIGSITSNYFQMFNLSTVTRNIVAGISAASTITVGASLIPAYSTNIISTISLGNPTNRFFQGFFVSTITSSITTDLVATGTLSTTNIIGFNLLGTTILSTQAIFCSSLQIGPSDSILDILGPLRTQDLSTVTCQASTLTANTVTLNGIFGGSLVANATTTQNLNPFTVGAQIGFGSNTAQLGFYSEGHFRSTFTQVIQPTLDAGAFSNIVRINGNISSQIINVSTIFGTLISTNTTFTTNLFGPAGGSAVNCGNLYPTGVNVLGFNTGGPGNGPWDSASIRFTQTSSIITNNISSGVINVSTLNANAFTIGSGVGYVNIPFLQTILTSSIQVNSAVINSSTINSGTVTLTTGGFTQRVVSSAVAPSGTVTLNLTSGNVFYFTTAMGTSATANFTTANATVGSTYYVNFLTGLTPGAVTFTGNTGATTLSINGLSLVGNPSVSIGLHGAGQSFTPAASTRYMFTCIAIAT